MTRDPDRIDDVLGIVADEWRDSPDLRLGQLLWKIADGDPFYLEDDELVRRIRSDESTQQKEQGSDSHSGGSDIYSYEPISKSIDAYLYEAYLSDRAANSSESEEEERGLTKYEARLFLELLERVEADMEVASQSAWEGDVSSDEQYERWGSEGGALFTDSTRKRYRRFVANAYLPDQPERPADPRPDNEPYYIESDCPECGTALELYDLGSGWYDEWTCPKCDDGLHMDWPEAQRRQLLERTEDDDQEFVALEDVEERLDRKRESQRQQLIEDAEKLREHLDGSITTEEIVAVIRNIRSQSLQSDEDID